MRSRHVRARLAAVLAGSVLATVAGVATAPLASAGPWTVRPIGSPGVDANLLAQELAGEGVTVSGASFTGDPSQGGMFADPAGSIGIAEGVVLSSGEVAEVVGPNDNGGNTSGSFFGPGDADLDALVGGTTRDAAVLNMTFVPTGADLEINYVFASEEYQEWVNSSFNDVFGFFVNGTNCATVAEADGTTLPVSVNSINHQKNTQIYVDNPSGAGPYDTQFDGFTQVLTCFATVTPGVPNTLKLALADTSDSILDSAVFLETSGITSTPKTRFSPLAPARIYDSRTTGAKPGVNGVVTMPILGQAGVPADALSVALNVTATEPEADGFVTVYPTGTARPTASNVNYTAGASVPNLVVAKIGVGGTIDLYTSQSSHLVVDVFGWFGVNAASGFTPIVAARAIDTRTTSKPADGGIVTFPVTIGGVPSGATSVLLNLTVTQPSAPSFAAVFASGGAVPATSNVNVVTNEDRPNLTFAPVGPDGQVSVFTYKSSHIVADVLGWFSPDGSGELFKAVKPKRVIDTRPSGNKIPTGGFIDVKVTDIVGVPSTASAVILNVTATEANGGGYLTIYPSNAAQPTASNVNYVAGQTIPNVAVSGVSPDGRVRIFAFQGTHVIVDVAGWFG